MDGIDEIISAEEHDELCENLAHLRDPEQPFHPVLELNPEENYYETIDLYI